MSNDESIPPMPELAAWMLKHEINKYPSLTEADVANRARKRILNRRGGKGQYLTETAKYWIARMQGGGGVGKNSVLPIGHTTMDKQLSWREGFRTEGDSVIVMERDYPGLDLKQIADLFTAQAILLYRTETRGSNSGPDISNLGSTEPLTAINMGDDRNFDLLLEQRIGREAYANTVLGSLNIAVADADGIKFNSTRGRFSGTHPVNFGPGTEVVGLALQLPAPNEPTPLVCIEIQGISLQSRKTLVERAHELSRMIEFELSTITMTCSKGKSALIYIAGGALGGISYNDVFDKLATMGKLIGSPAPNSAVAYKDIEFKQLGIKVSRETFTRRNEDVLQLPLSLDIYPSKEKTSMSKAYEGSQKLGMAFNQSGLSIVPISDPILFDPDYDDHPSIVRYRMNELVPRVIEFLRVARVAKEAEEVNPTKLDTNQNGTWQKMRAASVQIKEVTQEELEQVNDAFCIPKGREVVLDYRNGAATLAFNNEFVLSGLPQTNDFSEFCRGEGLTQCTAIGILCPTDQTSHSLVDRALNLTEIPTDLGESLNIFMPLEVQVFDLIPNESPFLGFDLSRLRSLAYPHAKFVRNISTKTEGTNFAELINDELDSGYATRVLVHLNDGVKKKLVFQAGT